MRAIDIEFAERAITDYKRSQTVSHYATSEECKAVWYGMELAIMVLHGCPTLDVEPVVHAKWIRYDTEAYGGDDGHGEPKWIPKKFYRCHHCRKGSAVKTPRCPNCGAHMDGGEV